MRRPNKDLDSDIVKSIENLRELPPEIGKNLDGIHGDIYDLVNGGGQE